MTQTGGRETTEPARKSTRHGGHDVLATVVSHLPGTLFRLLAVAPWRVVYMSGEHEVSTGRRTDGFIGNELYFDLIHPQDREFFASNLEQALSQRRDFVAEYRVRHFDGSWHRARQYARGVYADDGSARAVDGVIFDITDGRGREESVRILADALPMAVYQYRVEENGGSSMLYISDAIETLVGVSAQAVMTDVGALSARIDPRDLDRFIDAEIEAHASHREFAQEVRFLRTDGELRWMSVRSMPHTREDGSVIYQGYIEDITDRKFADERVRSSESLLQQIFDTSNVAIFLVDAYGMISRANRKMAEMFACRIDEIEGSPYVSLVDPAEREEGRRKMLALMGSDIDSVNLERLYQRRDGTLFWGNLSGRRFRSEHDAEDGLLGVIMDISERKRAEDEVRSLAFYDPLTNLANRRLLLEYLQGALTASERSGLYGALIFIDLDNFKTLNDTLGHDTGDQLLVSVARRLQETVRAEDTVARLGGDEFVVVLSGLHASAPAAADSANVVARKIGQKLAQPHAAGNHAVRSTPSLGITLFRGSEASIDDLLKYADMAMYEAKTAGRNTVRFFDPAMQERVNARARIERELYGAIENGQFSVFLQPQIDIRGRCIGAEALVRWLHPVKGLICPGEFIAIAEDTGQIREIGHAVLRQAMEIQKKWQQSSATRDIVIAVNLSARQLHSKPLIQEIGALLAATGADPSRLQFELTESIFLGDVDEAVARMLAIQELGISFALDDFGTGWSSLAYLKQLPLRWMKIDRSFVHNILVNPDDQAICRAIIVLARSLGLQVLAEGVENKAQWQRLRADGCEAAQGYLFARPMPESQFIEWLSTVPTHV